MARPTTQRAQPSGLATDRPPPQRELLEPLESLQLKHRSPVSIHLQHSTVARDAPSSFGASPSDHLISSFMANHSIVRVLGYNLYFFLKSFMESATS